MRVLGLDFESTGVNTKEDRITEVGAVIWDTDFNRPLKIYSSFVKCEKPLTEEITKLTGISPEMLSEFGEPLSFALGIVQGMMSKCEYVVAHNGRNFDKPLLEAEMVRIGQHGLDRPWIDTRYDLPLEDKPDSTKLKYMAADSGFINPFPHRAIFDVLTMLRLLSNYDIEQVVEYMRSPSVIIRAVIPGPWDDGGVAKEKARLAGYRWQDLDGKKFEKMWVKIIKKSAFNKEQEAMKGYQCVILEDIQ